MQLHLHVNQQCEQTKKSSGPHARGAARGCVDFSDGVEWDLQQSRPAGRAASSRFSTCVRLKLNLARGIRGCTVSYKSKVSLYFTLCTKD